MVRADIGGVAGERAGDGRERPLGAGGQPGAGQHERQRVVRARRGQTGSGLGLGRDALATCETGQQVDGGSRFQRAEPVEARTVDSQLPQGGPAGDDGHARGPGGEQRADLGGVGGVVEKYGDRAAGSGRAPQPGQLPQLGGGTVKPERAQPVPENGFRRHGTRCRILEIGVELPVAVAIVMIVEPAGSQCALPHAADAAEHQDPGAGRTGRVQSRPLVLAIGEVRRLVGKLPWKRQGRGRDMVVDATVHAAGLDDQTGRPGLRDGVVHAGLLRCRAAGAHDVVSGCTSHSADWQSSSHLSSSRYRSASWLIAAWQ